MKVALLNDSFPPVIDGVANVVKNYAGIMTEENLAEVMVGTPRYPGTDYDAYPYEVVAYKSYNTTALVNGYRTGNPLQMHAVNALAGFSPDIIHTHCPMVSTVLARILRKETYAPIVFTYHTKFDVDIARAVKSRHLRKESIKMLVSNISACDEVWTVSEGAGQNLRSLGYEGDYRVVSNGVDFERGRADADTVQRAVEGFDLPEGVPVFLFVGRILNYKGLPLILDAMRELSGDGVDYRCVMVGSGGDKEALQETARRFGLSVDIREEDGSIRQHRGSLPAGKIIFVGPVHDRQLLRGWNTRADLFLFPSTYDTNGIVVREAAACALASVLIEGSCAAEGITDGRNGFTIREDPHAMAALLRDIAAHPEAAHTAGQHAMEEIYISWEDSVAKAVDRYAIVLEKRRAGLLPQPRQGRSEQMLGRTAEAMDALGSVMQMPWTIYEGLYYGMLENYVAAEQKLHSTKEAIRQGVQESITDIHDTYHEQKANLQEKTQALSDNLRGVTDKMQEKGENLRSGLHGLKENVKSNVKDGWSKLADNKKDRE